MICPKCGMKLRNDTYCTNCNEYLFNMEKPTKSATVKSWFKIFAITLGCYAIFMLLVLGVTSLSTKNRHSVLASEQYNEIYQDYQEENYYSALSKIDDFKEDYSNNKKLIAEIGALSLKMDEILYQEIINTQDLEEKESNCLSYINSLPEGKHIKEVKEARQATQVALIPLRLAQAKQKINEGEYLDANSLLEKIINNSNNPYDENVLAAQQLKLLISKQVEFETTVYVDIQDLMSNAQNYEMRNVSLQTDVMVTYVDRERQMLTVSPLSENSTLGYDYSFSLEIYYGNVSNPSKWSSLSLQEENIIRKVRGRFKIYSNRSNSGYIDAESISEYGF